MDKQIVIKKPSDMHIHLRQDDLLKITVREAEKWFSFGVIMPNTIPPVTTPERLIGYKNKISEIAPEFKPVMTFKLYPGMKGNAVKKLAEAGAKAGKLYPAGVTTNSEDGIRSWRSIKAALGAMSDLGLILSIHCEKPGIFCLDREYRYHREFISIVKAFPDLKIVFEHISDRRSVDLVADMPDRISGTITAHHLLLTLDDVIGGSMNPHDFCKPLAKTEKDREALRAAAFSGNSKFFFGSDSAPHLKCKKESGSAGAGIYSAPCALLLLTELFESEGKLDMLEDFVSVYGPSFYNLPETKEEITFVKNGFTVPDIADGIVPFMAGRRIPWNCPKGILKTIIDGNYGV